MDNCEVSPLMFVVSCSISECQCPSSFKRVAFTMRSLRKTSSTAKFVCVFMWSLLIFLRVNLPCLYCFFCYNRLLYLLSCLCWNAPRCKNTNVKCPIKRKRTRKMIKYLSLTTTVTYSSIPTFISPYRTEFHSLASPSFVPSYRRLIHRIEHWTATLLNGTMKTSSALSIHNQLQLAIFVRH